jgi:hypothetical protein
MISFDEIKSFFADSIRRNPSYFEYMLKEYFHYQMLDIIFSGKHAFIQKFNVFTQVFAPSPAILLSMKTGAVLERGKGRDYYDFIFLSGLTDPDFGYLHEKFGITNHTELYERILESCKAIDFEKKSRDFAKLVFDPAERKKVLLFKEYIRQKYSQ